MEHTPIDLVYEKFSEALVEEPDVKDVVLVSGVNGLLHRGFRVDGRHTATFEECNLDVSHRHDATVDEIRGAVLSDLCQHCFPR